ncbi:MAG: DUF4350 domain-containing protein [Fimbriimonadales bacterium]
MRAPLPNWVKVAVLVGVLGALLMLSQLLLMQSFDPRFAQRPLSYSQNRDGAKALARLLERNGYTVRSFKRTFRHLPDEADLLVMFPSAQPSPEVLSAYTEEDSQALEEWVRRGGRLLLMTNDTRLPEAVAHKGLGAPFIATRSDRTREVKPLLNAEWLRKVRTVRIGLGRFSSARLSPAERDWVPLLGDGDVVVALRKFGKGYIVEAGDWQWLSNSDLREADNALFILSLVRWLLPKGGTIYFDDAWQGDILLDEIPQSGFWAYAPTGLKIAFAHLLVVAAIALYSVGKRFGLPMPSRPPAPPLGEFVEAMANLYASGQAVRPAFEVVMDDLRRRLCGRLGLPAGSTLLQVAQSLPPGSPLREALLEAIEALNQPQLSPEKAIQIIRRIDASL